MPCLSQLCPMRRLKHQQRRCRWQRPVLAAAAMKMALVESLEELHACPYMPFQWNPNYGTETCSYLPPRYAADRPQRNHPCLGRPGRGTPPQRRMRSWATLRHEQLMTARRWSPCQHRCRCSQHHRHRHDRTPTRFIFRKAIQKQTQKRTARHGGVPQPGLGPTLSR